MNEDITKKSEDTTKLCGRCGQPVDRLKDSYKTIDGQAVHTSCPTSPEMKAVPVLSTFTPSIQYLRMEEAARMLTVSVKTIQRRIRSGELPAKRLLGAGTGGRQTILIDQADVLALLQPYVAEEAEMEKEAEL